MTRPVRRELESTVLKKKSTLLCVELVESCEGRKFKKEEGTEENSVTLF